MSLTSLSALASVLSSLAVFGSLIYLALQVRQTDRNQRTLLQQGASARNMESIWKFAEPHNADIVARVWKGESDFSPAQATQIAYLIRASLLGFQDQFLLKQRGLVHATQAETQDRAIRRVLSMPAFRALWVLTRADYAQEFAAYIDKVLSDAPLATQDFAADIKSTVTALTAAAPARP